MKETQQVLRRAKKEEAFVRHLFFVFSLVAIFTTLGIIGMLFFESVLFFRKVNVLSFLTDTQWTPLFYEKHFGILPLLCGTFLTTGIAVLVAAPLGILIAIFLSEYATPRTRSICKPILEVLAGVPTVVYGYFALLFVTPLLKRVIPSLAGFNALSPGIVMGIMILPLVSSLSEDAMHAVPQSLREAGYALGSTKFEVATKIVFPAAFSGVTASFILALSRAIGETMLVTIAAGSMPQLTLNPFVPIMTMTAFIATVSLGDVPAGTLEYQTIFAVGLVLFLFTFFLNLIARRLRQRFREVYQ
ncbi:phosphate ABC transporter permease subunit PstC [Candidatus Caldatribacterium saccharofermentans]|uniref:Phosphate transport system permease protein n=1 Tax=Candidatus Caldatribacterium saccharofermentans TaxID=1454753 RepID=A0A7V4TGR1_9BACT